MHKRRQQLLQSAHECDKTYGAVDGAIVGRGALGGDGDAVGGLELDLKDRCRGTSVTVPMQEVRVAKLTSSGVVEVLVQKLKHAELALPGQAGVRNCASKRRNADVRRWPTWGCR